MNDLMMYVGGYILILIAIALTVGLAFALIVGRSVAIKHKAFDKELDAMTQRIKNRNQLNGKATSHQINLSDAKSEYWTGEQPRTRKAPPKPKHPKR